jgi:hypothetical protein
MATRPSGRRSKSAHQTKITTVVLVLEILREQFPPGLKHEHRWAWLAEILLRHWVSITGRPGVAHQANPGVKFAAQALTALGYGVVTPGAVAKALKAQLKRTPEQIAASTQRNVHEFFWALDHMGDKKRRKFVTVTSR